MVIRTRRSRQARQRKIYEMDVLSMRIRRIQPTSVNAAPNDSARSVADAAYALRRAALSIASMLRSTSSSVVDQLLTLILIAVRPFQTVPPHQHVPSR
jgi:hypothetical protein